jgi:dipeptidyl-peptidase-4
MTIHGIKTIVILIILCTLLQTSSGCGSKPAQGKQLTVELIQGSEELWGNDVTGVQWHPDGESFTYCQVDPQNNQTSIWRYELASGRREILIDSSSIKALEGSQSEKRFALGNYSWSPSGKEILLPSGNDLYLYYPETGLIRRLTNDEEPEMDPQFSPDSKKIAFIKSHNVQVLDLQSGITTSLTSEGREHILVGQFDWVYEEEFGMHTGFFWSPDSQHIAYWKLDETEVPEFPIVDFIPVQNTVDTMRYPKAGDNNSIVQIGVVSVDGQTNIWMDIGNNTDIYIPRIKWLPNGKSLAIYRLNREQNKLELMLGDIENGKTGVILTEEEDNGWIDIYDDFAFLENGEQFVWASNRNGFKHLYVYDIQGNLVSQITDGNWEVDYLAGVDEASGFAYFTATEKTPWERHLYRAGFNGHNLERLSTDDGWHSINMSPDCRYYLDFFSTYIHPPAVSLHTADGKQAAVIEPNDIESLAEYHLSAPEFFTFETDDGIELNAFMIKPPDFDKDKKYPVLMYTYGGPGSQIVCNVWESDSRKRNLWHEMMAQKGYIVFGVDNRGTGGRGKDWMYTIYKNLGDYEVQDQINGVKYLRTLPYVDNSRIGIWGWSYGGYNTLMCMLKGADYFKMGIAVAPPTDWRNYDTIYTERYMGTPEDNPQGYETSSALNYVDNLRGKLLVIHGSADDNVHLANAMQLSYAFQNARIPFDLMVYPRKLHHIDGVDTRMHLFSLMTAYVEENL